jgi:ribosomal protein L29
MENLNNSELRALSFEQLGMRMDECRRDLLELRLKAATTHVKSFSSDQKKLKRAIAQVLTHMRIKQMATFE